MREQTIDLGTLVRDDRLRFREAFNIAGMSEKYAESMKESEGWGDFPPLVCLELTEPHSWSEETDREHSANENDNRYGRKKAKFAKRLYEAGTMLLIGGFTRSAAADLANVTEAPAKIHHGTWADALRLAWIENAHHGKLRSTNETALVLESIHQDEANRTKPEREVAKLAGCSRATVNRWRAEQKRILERIAAAENASKEAPKIGLFDQICESEDSSSENKKPTEAESERPASVPMTAPSAGVLVKRDGFGRPIPLWIAPLWEHVGPASKITRELSAAVKGLVILKHGPEGREECIAPGLSRVDCKGAAHTVLHAVEMIDNALPWIVCPACDGHGRGCKPCHGLGTLTKAEADSLHGELDRKARSFQGVAA